MSVKCRVLKCGECEITQSYGGANNHLGTDIVGKGYTLDTILAHTDGIVTYIQTGHKNNKGSTGDASYGNMIKLDHGNGNYTLYAHLDRVYVSNGQRISKGQELGYMGNTGNSYGGHLHFEVFKDNIRVDSGPYLNANIIEPLVQPVARNENKNQIKVNVIDLRIRKGAGINQAILGFAKENGVYDYYETKEIDGYVWYKIADNQWVANSQNWCTIYLKKEVEDETMIVELQNQIEELESEKQELMKQNKQLEKELATLNEQEKNFSIFEAKEDGLYGINLKAYEVLKYEKN